MKDIFRQIVVVVSVLVTLVVNWLANTLPFNGLTTGEVSDQFQVYFVPAGYVFSIWGVIYLGLIAYAVFQALPAQRQNPRMRATGWWVAFTGLANSTWLFLWHYELFPLTLVAMLSLLAALIVIYLRLGIGRTSVSMLETLTTRVPFSIYLGWITVATVANITSALDYVNWNRFGLSPETWMTIILAAVLTIVTLVIFTRRDLAYTLVIFWALIGIAVRHPAVAAQTWVTFGLVALMLAAAFLWRRPVQAGLRRNRVDV